MSIKDSFIKDIKELMANVQPKPDASGYYKYLDTVGSVLIATYSSCFEELETYEGLAVPKVEDNNVLEAMKERLKNSNDLTSITGLCKDVDCPEYLDCGACLFAACNGASLMRYLGMDPTEPQVEELPKLTVEVFDRPDCPKWANYAVINWNGRLTFFANKPKFEGEDYGCWSCSYAKCKHIDNANFDATNWRNSLIERPAKALPDWCKVGETCYDYGSGYYFKVTGIDDEKSEVSISWEPSMLADVISYSIFKEYAKPANKRPFNDKEMLDLLGKVVSSPGEDWRSLILWTSSTEVTTYYGNYNADTLMSEGYIIDGKPCYKLEHLNEKGEWVE